MCAISPSWLRYIAASILILPLLLWDPNLPAFGKDIPLAPGKGLGTAVSKVVGEEIAAGHLTGAVVVIGMGGEVAFRGAFGERMVTPQRLPMTLDTVFDLASLTKVVATTTAIMQLQEEGKLQFDQPVSRYWPEFAKNGKQSITIADLLTHYSALPADLPVPATYDDYRTAMAAIAETAPLAEPGTTFSYSDIDFSALGEIVQRVSGLPLDIYCQRHIFAPLGMHATTFHVAPAQLPKTAPADVEAGELVWGKVQDPMARNMGGVSGHAGLFSTAADLTRFAEMLLAGGIGNNHRILRSSSVAAMTTPQSPPGQAALRGYGWDIDSPYSMLFSPFFSPRSYGHTGYTGTAIWIDPESRSFVIILTNRLHPDGTGSARQLEQRLSALVGDAAARRIGRDQVMTGIEVLKAYGFRQLAGRRIGLLTHAAGTDSEGHRTVDLFASAGNLHLRTIFSPEHGLSSAAEQQVSSGVDARTGLPIYSLYGDMLRPTDQMLQGLDAIVIDLQDVGARFYTYPTTMAYVMEAAAQKGLDVYVLDRPNPIGDAVQGPMSDPARRSFTNYLPMPVRHGMTLGELARMFNEAGDIHANLHVIAMRHDKPERPFAETGLRWIAPSPNLPHPGEALLYPGVALLEGANVSVGRGTPTPFELVGAPWIDGPKLASELSRRNFAGVVIEAADFTPQRDAFAGQPCHGIRLSITDESRLDSPRLGLEIIAALYRAYPARFDIDRTLDMVGSDSTLAAVKAGTPPGEIAAKWPSEAAAFMAQRQKYLIYSDGN
ncbi:MAG TPA: serine hydrolase [Dongiaceae bacterium]|nr:serine hydrolase [Dongiaceae bacterium]